MGRAPTRRLRASAVMSLIMIGVVLTPLAIVANWLDRLATDTDDYVETVGPMIEDPVVEAALSARLTELILGELDLGNRVAQGVDSLAAAPAVPDQLGLAADSLSLAMVDAAVRRIAETVNRAVISPELAGAWRSANRVAHDRLTTVLLGTGSSGVEVKNGAVWVDVATLTDTVKDQLAADGHRLAEHIADIDARFVLVQSDQLAAAQRGVNLLAAGALWLPLGALTAFVLAVLVAPDRRTTMIVAGLATSGTLLILAVTVFAVTVFAVKRLYLGSLPAEGVDPRVAEVVFEYLTAALRTRTWAVFWIALIIAATAYALAWRGRVPAMAGRIGQGLAGLRPRRGVTVVIDLRGHDGSTGQLNDADHIIESVYVRYDRGSAPAPDDNGGSPVRVVYEASESAHGEEARKEAD